MVGSLVPGPIQNDSSIDSLRLRNGPAPNLSWVVELPVPPVCHLKKNATHPEQFGIIIALHMQMLGAGDS